MTPHLRVALLAAALAGPTAALAQDPGPSTVDPQAVRDLLAARDHKARVLPGADHPTIDARRPDGINYSVRFYGCSGSASCRDLEFHATFDTDRTFDAQWANQWNADWAYGRVVVDPDGNPRIGLSVQMAGGLSPTDRGAVLDLWDETLSGSLTDIGW